MAWKYAVPAEIRAMKPRGTMDISDRVARMRAMVDRGDYFCVNLTRQYGKTTMLSALRRDLAGDYAVAGLDF